MRECVLDPALSKVKIAEIAENRALETPVPDLSQDSQGELAMAASLHEPALILIEISQVAEHDALFAPVAHDAVDGERGLEMGSRLLHLALLTMEDAQVAEYDALAARVAHLAVDGKRGLVVGSPLLRPALLEMETAHAAKYSAFGAAVAHLSRGGQRLLEMRPRLHQRSGDGLGDRRQAESMNAEPWVTQNRQHLACEGDGPRCRSLRFEYGGRCAVGERRDLLVPFS